MSQRLNLVMQMLSVEQVMHADADTIDLVSVSRTDTTAGPIENRTFTGVLFANPSN